MSEVLATALFVLPSAASAQWCPAAGPEQVPARVTADATIAAPASDAGDRIVIDGVVRTASGSPVRDVVIFAYHTNRAGVYPRVSGAQGIAQTVGGLHGWVRTGADGRYRFTTTRPGAYPRGGEAQHVHIRIMPPNGVPCEIDAVEFTDDPLLTAAERRKRRAVGGTGIVTPRRDASGVWRATRDIVLPPTTRTDTLRIDADASQIRWVGTKFGGRGRHEGTIDASAGQLVLGGDALVHGRIVFPIRSMEITDIPLWEPVPRGHIRRRLLGPAMFDSARFPTATLVLQRARRTGPATMRIDALLTMRDVTRPLAFDARVVEMGESTAAAEATFRIDRHQWGLSYRGSQAGNDLIDDDIEFRVRLLAKR